MSDYHIELVRILKKPDMTLGYINIDGRLFFTIERPWIPSEKSKGGKRFISCVPSGYDYLLRSHNGSRFKNTFCLVNNEADVLQYSHEGNPHSRYACLLHVANTAREVNGCIGAGLGYKSDMVIQSRSAISDLNTIISCQKSMGKDVYLRIKNVGS